MNKLKGRNILITGGAHRIGRALSLAVAVNQGKVILHYGKSKAKALETQEIIRSLGSEAYLIQADLSKENQTAQLIQRATEFGPLFALVNNAAIFSSLDFQNTTIEDWHRHIDINLTAPFLLCKSFAESIQTNQHGRIINILDWRAFRPGTDHFAYTISKSALLALTYALANALSPNITVNGMALGAILPPSDGKQTNGILKNIPAKRWAKIEEVQETLIFLLTGPEYITGEVVHVDGGRHLI